MAVQDQANSVAYLTDGIALAYPVPYYFKAFSDLVVSYKNAAGVVVTKLLTADYTVSGVLDPKLNNYSNGGTVTFGVVLTAGGQVRITRRTPRTQPAVFNNLDPLPSGLVEGAHDTATLILQDLAAIGFTGLADGPPTSGTYNFGEWKKNANAGAGDTFGWYTTGGSPGLWYELFTISQLPA